MRLVTLALTIVSLVLLFSLRDGVPGVGQQLRQVTIAAADLVTAKASHPSSPTLDERLAQRNLREGTPIYIRIFKESRELEVWLQTDSGQFDLLNIYPICAYSGKLGPKILEGDQQAPEGFYHVSAGALLPTSRYHKAFNLGYPNAYDRAHGRIGSFLMVHGSCVSIGCYAMTNDGIDEIYRLVEAALGSGQPFFRVHIFPFRMTDAKLKEYSNNNWYDYWLNLKEGYDYFEANQRPPNVTVDNNRYAFSKE